LPVSNTRISVKPAAEPTSSRYDDGGGPEVGAFHWRLTRLPLTCEKNAIGASGGPGQPVGPTLTVISLDGTLTSLKSTRVLCIRAKYVPGGTLKTE
jgi:hypothetical protein